jgi:hypothetical protein
MRFNDYENYERIYAIMNFYKLCSKNDENACVNIGLAKSDDDTKCYGMYGEIKALREAKILKKVFKNVKDTDWVFIENTTDWTIIEYAKKEGHNKFACGETFVAATEQEIKEYIFETVKGWSD